MAKPRYTRLQPRKSSSYTLILTMLVMFSFIVLVLLALGILSIPNASSHYSRKANDISSIVTQFYQETKEECEYLISIEKPHMHNSSVVDSETGKSGCPVIRGNKLSSTKWMRVYKYKV